MKIYKTEEMIQGENKWHSWRNGKFTSTKVKSLFGFIEKTKDDYIKEAQLLKLELPTKTVYAGKPNERIDIDVSAEQVKEIVKEKLGNNFTSRKFVLKDDLNNLNIDELPKIVYDLIAYELSNGSAPTDETPIERGHRLESIIREHVNEKYGYNFTEVGGLERDDYPEIANSPDGVEISENDIIETSFEAKAFSGGKHVKAFLSKKYPDEHFPQVLQYFVVNDDLKKLVFTMGCPEITEFPYIVFDIMREDIENEIEMALNQQKLAIDLSRKIKADIQF